MLAIGLNWWQAFLTMLFGHLLGAFLVVAASVPGLYYKISFPVATRFAWGYSGSIFVVLNRIMLSIVWCGVQSWQGGLMTYVCIRAIWPSIDSIHNTIPAKTGMTLPQFVGFIVFFVIQFPPLLLSPKALRYLVYVGSTTGFLVQLVLCIWACSTMGAAGFGDIISITSGPVHGSQFAWMCVYSITVTISSITSGTVSVCDYARFARHPSSGTWSQLLGFFPGWLSNVMGTLTIAATQRRYGSALWSVSSLLIAIQDANDDSKTRAAVFFAGLSFGISQISLNVVGNTFSGGTDMSALLPKYINIRRGQILTMFLGLIINPWYLLSGAVVFISAMSAYTIFLQPFLGILVAHYFIIQRRRINVPDLYCLKAGIYWYTAGINWRSVVAVSLQLQIKMNVPANYHSGSSEPYLMYPASSPWLTPPSKCHRAHRICIIYVHSLGSSSVSLLLQPAMHPNSHFHSFCRIHCPSLALPCCGTAELRGLYYAP